MIELRMMKRCLRMQVTGSDEEKLPLRQEVEDEKAMDCERKKVTRRQETLLAIYRASRGSLI
jgi:hypothetical protein